MGHMANQKNSTSSPQKALFAEDQRKGDANLLEAVVGVLGVGATAAVDTVLDVLDVAAGQAVEEAVLDVGLVGVDADGLEGVGDVLPVVT